MINRKNSNLWWFSVFCKKILHLCLICFLFLFLTLPVFANEYPIGFGVWRTIQYPSEEDSIRGVRFNLFFGVNDNLTGFDLGGLVTSPLFSLNVVDGDLRGFQWGMANRSNRLSGEEGRTAGMQLGVFNIADGRVSGGQVGFWNYAGELNGFQIGLINRVRELNGLQIGLYNSRQAPERNLPRSGPTISPLLNWSF